MSRGWVVGTEDFTAGLKKQRARGAESSERLELLGGGPGARPQLREETWEAALPEFLYAWAKTLRTWLEENSSATTVSIINKGRFLAARAWPIPPRILIAGSLYLAGEVLEENGTVVE